MHEEKLTLLHAMAATFSKQLAGNVSLTPKEVVDRSYEIGALMIERIDEIEERELIKRHQKEEHEYDPVQHFVESLMHSIGKSKA